MTQDRKRRFVLLFIAVAVAIVLAVSCRNSAKPPSLEATLQPTGEPEIYTAIIVRSIEDNQHRDITERLVARAGDSRREEWTEKGERWVVITRFDAGKSFFLNLNQQTYIETDLAGKATEPTESKSAKPIQNATAAQAQGADMSSHPWALDFVEDRFVEEPTSLETRALADEYLANQLCQVVEKRAGFADGRLEVTRIYRAENLSGLAMKTVSETISPHHHVKVVTEWREIKLEASPEAFVIPAHFKKVQR